MPETFKKELFDRAKIALSKNEGSFDFEKHILENYKEPQTADNLQTSTDEKN